MATKKTRKPSRKPSPKAQAEQKARVAEAQAALTEGIKSLVTGDDWLSFLEKMARRGKFSPARFSFTNQMLVEMQASGTDCCATYAAWKRLGRTVIKGEKAMWILRPIQCVRKEKNAETGKEEVVGAWMVFRPLAQFGIDQTEGPEPPEGVRGVTSLCQEVSGDEIFAGSVETLAKLAKSLDDDPVSDVVIRAREPQDPKGAYGWYNSLTREIVVVDGERTRLDMFHTLVHEVAHSLLHGKGDHHTSSEKEVEAESTAFVVCKALGVDTGSFSFAYVSTWAGRDGDKAVKSIQVSGDRIAKAASRILDVLMPEVAEVEADSEAA